MEKIKLDLLEEKQADVVHMINCLSTMIDDILFYDFCSLDPTNENFSECYRRGVDKMNIINYSLKQLKEECDMVYENIVKLGHHEISS